MAYISQQVRDDIDRSPVGNCKILNSEELAYAILILCKEMHNGSYVEVISGIEIAKQEYYRQVMTPKFEQKRFDNGDI